MAPAAPPRPSDPPRPTRPPEPAPRLYSDVLPDVIWDPSIELLPDRAMRPWRLHLGFVITLAVLVGGLLGIEAYFLLSQFNRLDIPQRLIVSVADGVLLALGVVAAFRFAPDLYTSLNRRDDDRITVQLSKQLVWVFLGVALSAFVALIILFPFIVDQPAGIFVLIRTGILVVLLAGVYGPGLMSFVLFLRWLYHTQQQDPTKVFMAMFALAAFLFVVILRFLNFDFAADASGPALWDEIHRNLTNLAVLGVLLYVYSWAVRWVTDH